MMLTSVLKMLDFADVLLVRVLVMVVTLLLELADADVELLFDNVVVVLPATVVVELDAVVVLPATVVVIDDGLVVTPATEVVEPTTTTVAPATEVVIV